MSRWLKISLCLLAVLALAAATLPWWLGTAARPLLRRWDITLKNYEPAGYGGFRVAEIRFARGNTTVIARDLEGSAPLLWWQPSTRRLSAKTWSVEVRPAPTSASEKPGTIDGFSALHAQLQKIAAILQRQVPRATVGPGEVRWPRGGLTLAGATWSGRVLTAKGVRFLERDFDVEFDATHPELIVVQASHAPQEARLKVEWHAETAKGEGAFWRQPLQVQATMPKSGWLPVAAAVRGDNWVVPASQVRLGAQYTRLTGGGLVTWSDGAFALSLQARAEPKDGVQAPPLEGQLEAKGDTRSFTLTALRVDAPFAQATLSAPVVVGFDGQVRGEPARLDLHADLSKQPWITAGGQITGSLVVATAARQEFSLTLEKASLRGLTLQRASAKGSWQWPRLEVSQLEVQFDNTSRGEAAGSIDWQAREWSGVTINATAAAEWFARWLPAAATWKEGTIQGTIDGPLAAPRHAGKISLAQAKAGTLKPFDLAATWRGEGTAAIDFSAQLTAANSQLHVAGAREAEGIILRELRFAPAGVEVLALASPLRVEWSPVWRITHARLQGGTATLSLDAAGGDNGSFEISATNLDTKWVHDWLDLRGPTWRLRQLQASGKTTDHLLHFTATATGEIHLPGRDVAEVALAVTGDKGGLQLTELKISESGQVLTQATGRLPVTWAMDDRPQLRFPENAPLELQADVRAESPLWAALGEPAGITFTDATANAQLRGTLRAPEGDLRVTVAGLKVAADSSWRDHLPEVADFALVARADRAQVHLESLTAKVEGQDLRATARLPMDDGRWRQLLTKPTGFDWREAEAKLEIPHADLAPLARRLPAFIAAHGQLRAEVELTRGGNLRGFVRLIDAATRPLPALGVLQEITAAISFSGREARIDSFTARLGGEPVELRGKVDFGGTGPPRPDLNLTGKNLPLIRRAGLLVRSDLDLRLQPEGDRTSLSGLVTLRDCLVLTDLSDLLPTGVRGVRRLPPYFSVPTAPLNRWGLAVEVRGPSAVRVRTPFFTGTASAHFNLSGNLGEPRAIGEIIVDEGRMFFPFATFTVQNGAIRLRAADPLHPELSMNAISRRHSYELRLEASGSPEAPVLVFSSNPPLETGQVLLMVMAGQVPANEAAGTPGRGGLRLTQLGAYLGQGIYRGLGGTDENRLEIVSGEQISRQGRETYHVEYKLGERWALVGEYDEFDSYNGGVKWRIYTKEGSGGKK